jgi:hypothetical protein
MGFIGGTRMGSCFVVDSERNDPHKNGDLFCSSIVVERNDPYLWQERVLCWHL